jgi:hypothetical protein
VSVVVIAAAHGGFIAAGGMLLLTLLGVEERDSGAASAVLNATQQVGSSLGTALLNTIYATAVTSYIAVTCPRRPPSSSKAWSTTTGSGSRGAAPSSSWPRSW